MPIDTLFVARSQPLQFEVLTEPWHPRPAFRTVIGEPPKLRVIKMSRKEKTEPQ